VWYRIPQMVIAGFEQPGKTASPCITRSPPRAFSRSRGGVDNGRPEWRLSRPCRLRPSRLREGSIGISACLLKGNPGMSHSNRPPAVSQSFSPVQEVVYFEALYFDLPWCTLSDRRHEKFLPIGVQLLHIDDQLWMTGISHI
jgi:hypothetical protein